MAFSGADPTRLRVLARHMEHEIAPLLRRNAAIAFDVLERGDRHREADVVAHRLTALAAWAEDAGADLRRRAGIVESAQHLALWGPWMAARMRRSIRWDASAVVDGSYTGDAATDIADHTRRLAEAPARELASSLLDAIQAGDAATVAALAVALEDLADDPRFGPTAARVFAILGPVDTARLVATLLGQPRNRHDEATLLRLAHAFVTATHHGLTWTDDDVATWLDQGETGVVQLLRVGPVDPAFLARVVAIAGWAESGRGDAGGDPRLRRLLAPGSDVWSHVGLGAGDHRAVLLEALGHHLDLAVLLLDDPHTLDTLLGDPWPIDEGRALGRLLASIDAEGDAIDPQATDRIRRALLTRAADPAAGVPTGLRGALGAVAARHVADLAFSLAVAAPVVETTARDGIELDPSGVRRIIRLVAGDDAAYNRLLVGYGKHITDALGTASAEGAERLASVSDELGSLTFALAYVDREMRVERAKAEPAVRLSPGLVLGFLASAGSSLLPGPLDRGAPLVVDQVLQQVDKDQRLEAERTALASHNAWKELLLDDLEYLIALDMARHGLIPDVDPELPRVEFLYRLETMDGPLERIMAIVESQARRQREAVEEGR
jgi:hypothetical protein